MQYYQRSLSIFLITAICSLPCLSTHAQKNDPPQYDTLWTNDREPFRIAGNLYYVGTNDLACYLITTPQGNILINTGAPGSETMIRQHVEKLGFSFADIKILLITHGHVDHAGAMAAIKKMTGASLMVEAGDVKVLADGGLSDFALGGKHSHFLFPRVKVDRVLHDKDIIRLGDMSIELLHHPGHTIGASSFLFTVKDDTRSYRVLIANMPSIISETHLPSMPAYPNVVKDYQYTLDTMPKLQFDIWLSSHASQFGLSDKRKTGDAYHPEAFFDRAGYDSLLRELRTKFEERLRKANANK